MLQERIPDLSKCVEPDRVRREVYTDPDIFELEMQRIHERVWIYCGHESQVPKAGDYYTVQIGRQPMLMVRGADGKVNVLYNRCPHRGNMMCGDRKGNTGEFFRCSYHAWTFKHDGKLRSIPMMESGYAGTRWGKDNPDCSMKTAPRVENYRGFVFASLAKDGPTLKEFLGESRVAFDDMCDRAPEGEVEVVPNCFRVIQHSNWKIFLENQLDALHPSVVHQSTGRAAHEVEKQIEKRTGSAPLSYHMLSAFATVTIDKWDNFQTLNYPYGHCILTGYMGLRPKDPDTLAYEKVMHKAYGKQRTEEILAVNIHHVLIYPGLSVQSPLQQLRAVEQFLYRQADLLDSKRWQDWIDLFAPDGVYWMPADPSHKHWDGVPSIFAEDRNLMDVRMKRVLHPDAWSQRPMWGTNHVVSNVVIQKASPKGEIEVRSRFHMMELRRDDVRHFAGSYTHHLKKTKDGYRIKLQRVDMTNAQAAYDYVLQVWV